MKTIIALLTALSLSIILQAQTDTLTIYPKVIQAYDSALWTHNYGYGGHELDMLSSVEGHRLHRSYKNSDLTSRVAITLYFMADSVTKLQTILAELIESAENYSYIHIADTLVYKDFHFLAVREVPDECLPDGSATLNEMHVVAFCDAGEDFIYALSYSFQETNPTYNKWTLAKNLVDHCKILSTSEADQQCKYPLTEENAKAIMQRETEKVYAAEYQTFLTKRKCLSDYYLIEFMEEYYGTTAVKDLLRTQSDSTIAHKYAEAKSKEFADNEKREKESKMLSEFTYTEAYALKRQIRNNQITLNEYFDYINKGTRNSALKRLSNFKLLVPLNDLERTRIEQTRCLDMICKEIFKDTLQINFAEYLDKQGSFLLRITGRSKETHEYMLHVIPAENNNFKTQLYTLPELKDDNSKYSWQFAYTNQQAYTVLQNHDEDAYYIQPANNVNSDWIKIPQIDFGDSKAPLGALLSMSEISSSLPFQLACNYTYWKGNRKTELDSMIVQLNINYTLSEDDDKFTSYFMDELAVESYHKELYKFNYWSDYLYLPYAVNDTSYCNTEDYLSVMYQFMKPFEKIFFSELYIEDLTNDGIDDVFQFSIQNGKLHHYQFYSLENNTIKKVKSKKIKSLIENFPDYKNLLPESLKGNFYNNRTFQKLYKSRVIGEYYEGLEF